MQRTEDSNSRYGGSIDEQDAELLKALNQPARNGCTAYTPAEGQRMRISPPPFIWLPVNGVTSYFLEISRSSKFEAEQTVVLSDLLRPAFVPGKVLGAGRWYWRYGTTNSRGKLFSPAREFEIAEDAVAFPFPEAKMLAARVPVKRPRLFFSGERLANARLAANGAMKEQTASLVRECEAAFGAELPEERGKPADSQEAVRIIVNTRPPMDIMEKCALVYLLTGEERFAKEARRRLLHFFKWDPNGPTRFEEFDEPAMWMMRRGARAFDWVYETIPPEERAVIEHSMRVRASQFVKHLQAMPFELNPYDSHAGRLPGFVGEAALSFIHEWPEAEQWLDYANLLFLSAYPAWGGDDGGWQEGPNYWGHYVAYALHYVAALQQATGVRLIDKPFFRNTPWYILYTATPYHEQRAFGDGEHAVGEHPAETMCGFAFLLNNPYFLWYSRHPKARLPKTANLLSLAAFEPDLKPKAPLDLPQARLFESVGLASLHTALGDEQNDISFLLRSSPMGSQSHGHAAQNSYVIEAYGRALAIVTGYYPWFFSDHHENWTRASRSKNTILVDREGQTGRMWKAGAITAFRHNQDYDYVEGDASTAYGERVKRFLRQVVHVRPGIFVMFDDLEASDARRFQWLLHTYEKMEVDESRQRIYVKRSPAAMEVHLLWPPSLSFEQTDQYDPAPETSHYVNTWHLTASTIYPCERAKFLSVHLPHREGEAGSLPKVERVCCESAMGVKLTHPDGCTDKVVFATKQGSKTIDVAGLKSDARVFALGQDRTGRPIKSLLIDGTFLDPI